MPILRRLIANPRKVIFWDDQRTWRSIDLLIAAMHIADEIERKCKSETVGLLLPTSGLFGAAALAGWITGRVIVPLNYLLKQPELEYVIKDCEADTVLTVGPMLEHIGMTPRVPNVVRLETLNYKSFPTPRWPALKGPEDLGIILYTSGTSGSPKGVLLTHGNISANIQQATIHARFTKDDTVLGVLPQFHTFGLTVLTLLPLTIGCRAVYTSRFVPQRIVRLIRDRKPTAFVGISSMFGALLHVKSATPEDFASLRLAIAGGEPLSDAVAQGFKDRFGIRINEGYGLTETSPATNVLMPEDDAPHSVGRAVPCMDQRIINPDTGKEVPDGEEGEIRMKGPNVMRGYFKLEQQTKDAFDENGYFRTGDIGKKDARGFLYITGRLKEMLIVGGENVFPREIEEVLDAHEDVAASAVVGKKDDVRGELPFACVQMIEGKELDKQALKDWCRTRLAPYKIPREIRQLPALPRTGTGKIFRRVIGSFINGDITERAFEDACK